ncbi:uncharacterized protein LOC119192998 [Manduca sexta]|uniref:uncharacterized protein LOC119192998 n=1 Tax=Manduca sexta TaxID=7130 RepID=UPI00188E474C|nr:uncharacterized protein LOC119192998 [Manduca sexta]
MHYPRASGRPGLARLPLARPWPGSACTCMGILYVNRPACRGAPKGESGGNRFGDEYCCLSAACARRERRASRAPRASAATPACQAPTESPDRRGRKVTKATRENPVPWASEAAKATKATRAIKECPDSTRHARLAPMVCRCLAVAGDPQRSRCRCCRRARPGPGLGAADADHSEEEGDGDTADEYEGRDDELDAPRDYDDYTDNAHHAHHHD